jgi:hypothetical protein
MAIEEDPPKGEDPLIWILLTSLRRCSPPPSVRE